MKSINELRALSTKDLESELLELRKQQFSMRVKKANGALEKSHVIGHLRKSIARIKTIMTEKVGKTHDE